MRITQSRGDAVRRPRYRSAARTGRPTFFAAIPIAGPAAVPPEHVARGPLCAFRARTRDHAHARGRKSVWRRPNRDSGLGREERADELIAAPSPDFARRRSCVRRTAESGVGSAVPGNTQVRGCLRSV